MKRNSFILKSSIVVTLLFLTSCVNLPFNPGQDQGKLEYDSSNKITYHAVETGTSNTPMDASDCINEFMANYNKDGYIGAKITITSSTGFGDLGVDQVEFLSGLCQGEEIYKFGGLFLNNYPLNIPVICLDNSVIYNYLPLAESLYYFKALNQGRFMNQDMVATRNSLYIDVSYSNEKDTRYIKLNYSQNYLITNLNVTNLDATYTFNFKYFKKSDLPQRSSLIDKETFIGTYIGLANHKVDEYYTHVIYDGSGLVNTGRVDGDYFVSVYEYLKDVHVERFMEFTYNQYGLWFNPVSTTRSVEMRETEYKEPIYQNTDAVEDNYKDQALTGIFGTVLSINPYYLLSGNNSYYYDPQYAAIYMGSPSSEAAIEYSCYPLKINLKVGYAAKSIVFNDDGLVDAIAAFKEGETEAEPTTALARFEYSNTQDKFDKKNNYSYDELMKTSFFSDIVR